MESSEAQNIPGFIQGQISTWLDVTEHLDFSSVEEAKEFCKDPVLFDKYFQEHVEIYLEPMRHTDRNYSECVKFERCYFMILRREQSLLSEAKDRPNWDKESYLAYALIQIFHANVLEKNGLFHGQSLSKQDRQDAYHKIWVIFIYRRDSWIARHRKTVRTPLDRVNKNSRLRNNSFTGGQVTAVWPRRPQDKPLSEKINEITSKSWSQIKGEITWRFELQKRISCTYLLFVPMDFGLLSELISASNGPATALQMRDSLDNIGLDALWPSIAEFTQRTKIPLTITVTEKSLAFLFRGLTDTLEVKQICRKRNACPENKLNNFAKQKRLKLEGGPSSAQNECRTLVKAEPWTGTKNEPDDKEQPGIKAKYESVVVDRELASQADGKVKYVDEKIKNIKVSGVTGALRNEVSQQVAIVEMVEEYVLMTDEVEDAGLEMRDGDY